MSLNTYAVWPWDKRLWLHDDEGAAIEVTEKRQDIIDGVAVRSTNKWVLRLFVLPWSGANDGKIKVYAEDKATALDAVRRCAGG